MVQKLLLAFTFLFLASTAPAQDSPPYLDEVSWQVHSPAGPMNLWITAEYLGSDGVNDMYLLTTTGTLNGQPYTSWAYAFDTNDGSIDVYNGDSELWTQWVWDGDHYDKVGGTTNQRSYYPVYE